MENGDDSSRRKNVFKTRSLRNLLVASLLLVVVVPLSNWLFIYPSFKKMIVQMAEDNAIRAARHLASLTSHISSGGAELSRTPIEDSFLQHVQRVQKDLGLMKIKIFSPSGEILFSSTAGDMGKTNTKAYFKDIVAKGDPYTKFVHKDSESLENETVTMDVVDTYVPIMKGRRFLGAFEIYYDVTRVTTLLNELVIASSAIMLFLAFGLLLGIVMMLFQANAAIKQRDRTQKELQMAHDRLEQRVQERTKELKKNNTALKSQIAKRKRAEIALRESRGVLRRTFDQSPIGTAIVSLNQRFLTVNAEMCRIMGFSEKDMKALPFTNIVHPTEREAFKEKIQKLMANGKDQFQTVKRLISNNDAVAWARLSVALVRDANGQPLHFVPMVEDITAHKRTQEASRENETLFRTLTNLAPVGIIMTDSVGRCLFVNESWCKITGLSAKEAEGDGWIESIDPEDREQLAAQWSKCSESKDWFTLSYRIGASLGQTTRIEARTIPMHNEGGELTGYMGTISAHPLS